MVAFTAALGGTRDWSCCLCGAVGIRALDQVPKQTLNSFHMSPSTDPTGQTHSHFIFTLLHTHKHMQHTPCYRILIKHSLITAHGGVCKYSSVQNSSRDDKSHNAVAFLKSHTDDDASAWPCKHSGLTFNSYLKLSTMVKYNKGKGSNLE